MRKIKYKKHDNKYIEWLENNMNSYELFYFKESDTSDDVIECLYCVDDSKFCEFSKLILDKIIGAENHPVS